MHIEPAGSDRIEDLDRLFGCSDVTDRCWCMWFMIPVKDFHAAGREGNRTRFLELATAEESPLGLIAYDGTEPIGWCALGPRSRYVRAMRAPTMRGREGDDDATWFVPCFAVHPGRRDEGVATALLEAAVEVARVGGATAIEGFPLAGTKRRSGGSDFQTGTEALFTNVGFTPIDRPSGNRVIMRREL